MTASRWNFLIKKEILSLQNYAYYVNKYTLLINYRL